MESGQGTIGRIDQASMKFGGDARWPTEPVYWLDYLVLRQCMPDFDVKRIRDVIQEIGLTVAEIDRELGYLRRSFCIFEIYCTVTAGRHLLVNSGVMTAEMKEQLQLKPVDVAQAQTWREQDKSAIDSFIVESIGFDDFNQLVTRAVQDGTAEAEKLFMTAPVFSTW